MTEISSLTQLRSGPGSRDQVFQPVKKNGKAKRLSPSCHHLLCGWGEEKGGRDTISTFQKSDFVFLCLGFIIAAPFLEQLSLKGIPSPEFNWIYSYLYTPLS
jgi:hypothetical protein